MDQRAAISALENLIRNINLLQKVSAFSSEHTRWVINSLQILEDLLGKSSPIYSGFASLRWQYHGSIVAPQSFAGVVIEKKMREAYLSDLDSARGFLEAAIDQIRMKGLASVYKGGPAPERVSSNPSYDFSKIHPRVRKECESLFTTGHYSEAIRKAFTVLDVMVREKSGLDKSGKALMGEVFRLNDPIIRVNGLGDQSERDEQEGFMFLFMGSMQGIRNPKSHDLIDQQDPIRTLEYLAIASLLARRVDEGKVTQLEVRDRSAH
jgi:uncharacterized protein (TIGR02391 family)